jgi:hypothetical protein
MKTPNGKDLLRTLIALFAEQEGVKIECKIASESEG